MKKYGKVFLLSMNELLAYRFSFVSGYLSLIIPTCISMSLWHVIFKTGTGNFNGFDEKKMFYYIFIARVLSIIMTPQVHWDISEEIKSGQLFKYLLRPVNHLFFWGARSVAKLVQYLSFGIILFLFFSNLIITFVGSKLDFETFLYAVLSIALGTLLYFMIYYCVSLLTFSFVNISGFFYTIEMIIEFFSGLIIPLAFLPKSIFTINSCTPFPYLLSFPLNILLGNIEQKTVIHGIFMQILWIVIFLLLYRVMWKKGLNHYEGTGS